MSSNKQHQVNQEASELLASISNRANQLDQQLLNSRAATSAGREILFQQYLDETLHKVFRKGYCTPKHYSGKKSNKINRLDSILISDTHFHSLLDPKEVPVGYHAQQEARRFGKVAQQVADFKPQYRAESRLLIHLLGDIIQGCLHDPRDGAPLAMQFAAAVHYLTQLILFEASQYPSVMIYCTPGNHGRNMFRHRDRAIHQKWDSFETMLYTAVKAAVLGSGIKNVTFDIGQRPYYTVKLFNTNGFFTHGDTVLKPGFPGKSIDSKGLIQQVSRWNAAQNIGGPFQLFACGHVHIGSVINLPDKVTMITNGCLVPPDAFSLSIGAPDVTCGQYIFESVQDHAVGDQRFIRVDDADSEPGYEDFILPFSGNL
jgi:hypothetical protein